MNCDGCLGFINVHFAQGGVCIAAGGNGKDAASDNEGFFAVDAVGSGVDGNGAAADIAGFIDVDTVFCGGDIQDTVFDV